MRPAQDTNQTGAYKTADGALRRGRVAVGEAEVSSCSGMGHRGPSQSVTCEEGGYGHCYHCHQERDPVTVPSLQGEASVTGKLAGRRNSSHL